MDPSTLPLRDIHLPEAVGWWPLAPGWWVLLVLVILSVMVLSLRAWRRYREAAPRRYALRELQRIENEFRSDADADAVRLGRQVSELLRRSMLAYAPREEVAGLTGERWLQWLDRDMPVPYFHTDGGKSLLQLPYSNPHGDFSGVDTGALLSAVKMRLATPVGSQA